jgi:hypothetical protein
MRFASRIWKDLPRYRRCCYDFAGAPNVHIYTFADCAVPQEDLAVGQMDVYEAMRTLRAVRRLKPDPIPDDVLPRVLEAATFAPTGGNQQPWRKAWNCMGRCDERFMLRG